MENEILKGYYYGLRFDREWLIKGIKDLLYHIKINKDYNIISYFPTNDKYYYIIYNENLIKGNSSIENFRKCNHWMFIREKLDLTFDIIIKEHIIEFIDHPRKIFLF